VQRANGATYQTWVSKSTLHPCSTWLVNSVGVCVGTPKTRGACKECVEVPNITNRSSHTIPSTTGRVADWRDKLPNACNKVELNGECVEFPCEGLGEICKSIDGKPTCVFDCESSEIYCNRCEECVGTSTRQGNQRCVSKCGQNMVCGGTGNLPKDDPLNKSAGECICKKYGHGGTPPSGGFNDGVAFQECAKSTPHIRSVPNKSGVPNAIDGCECYCATIETCTHPDIFNGEDCSCTPYDAEALSIDLIP
jgi:hypothetical protein